jgi:hypothetical protein
MPPFQFAQGNSEFVSAGDPASAEVHRRWGQKWGQKLLLQHGPERRDWNDTIMGRFRTWRLLVEVT